jgi:uncharacterized protein YciI
MQFMVLAYDGTDEGALDRRLAVREAHLANARRLTETGFLVSGGAILGDDNRMIGSIALVEANSRAEVDEWLRTDPYVTGDVWRDIQVRPVKLAKFD